MWVLVIFFHMVNPPSAEGITFGPGKGTYNPVATEQECHDLYKEVVDSWTKDGKFVIDGYACDLRM